MWKVQSGLIAALFLVCAPAPAVTLLNIDFSGDYGAPQDAFGGAAAQAGVWNEIVALGQSPLVDLSGTPVPGAILDLNAQTLIGHSGGSQSDVQRLVNDNFYSFEPVGWALTISGIENGLYDIYYYAPSNENVSTGPFTVNGLTVIDVPNDEVDTTTLVQGVSYEIVRDVRVTSGTLSFVGQPSVFDLNTGLSGIQLVSAAVPLPAGSWLLLSGLGLLVARKGARPG